MSSQKFEHFPVQVRAFSKAKAVSLEMIQVFAREPMSYVTSVLKSTTTHVFS